jgi:prevent-host-death family protein
MNLATDIKPISYLKAKTADALHYVNDSHRPLIITQNGEAKAVIQDIESYQNMKNMIALLKLLAEGESDIQNNRFEAQDTFFERMEQKLAQ